DLTTNAGSTHISGEATKAQRGRYEGEVKRLNAPRSPRRSRNVDTARTGRGTREFVAGRTSRPALVQNTRRAGHCVRSVIERVSTVTYRSSVKTHLAPDIRHGRKG